MNRPRRERGFSLLEAVVALGILSLFILPLASLLNSGLAKVTAARHLSEASALLQRAVEETKQEDFTSLIPGETVISYPSEDTSSKYTLKRVVVDIADKSSVDGQAALKRVTLGIYLADGGSSDEPVAETEILLYRYNGL
ncbi:MAG: prepilin-type N-terminal cleavage/methylation domain-containing protein [Firmicutes bacterium]|nr:prepilin-type N-terminal cleavage/methylation domain-containing protein [Bacillota bacterium]